MKDTYTIVYHLQGKGMNVIEGLTKKDALEKINELVNDYIGTVLPKLTNVYLELERSK